MHWVSAGQGDALVLLHKLGGWVADWRHVAPRLAERFRVIAIDLPGHGDSLMSSPPPRVQTIQESASMVRATLAELGVERFSLAGNSLGGITCAMMAALFPRQVERLAIVSAALGTKATPAQLQAHEDDVPKIFTPDGRPRVRPMGAQAAQFGVTREIWLEGNASRARAGRWILPSERGVMAAGILDHLPDIQAQTLLVYGSGSAFYGSYRDNALKALKHGRDVTIEGSGGFPHQQKPAETAAVLGEFFSSAA